MRYQPYRLYDQPQVIAVQVDGEPEFALTKIRMLAHAVPRAHILIHFAWYNMSVFVEQLAEWRKTMPSGVEFHLMANTLEDQENFIKHGFNVVHVPASVYVNETLFQPIENIEKQYDAVYIAQFCPGQRKHFKRHYLASDIQRLKVVTYPGLLMVEGNGNPRLACASFIEPFLSLYPELSHASINPSRIPPWEVAEALNQSHVNLALSKEEGCMYAFTEGLLCGIPAISTPCVGGRELYFHPDYVRMVEPDEKAIAATVDDLKQHTFDPYAIRAFALGELHKYRQRYIEYIQSLTSAPYELLYTHIFQAEGGPERLCAPFERIAEPAELPGGFELLQDRRVSY